MRRVRGCRLGRMKSPAHRRRRDRRAARCRATRIAAMPSRSKSRWKSACSKDGARERTRTAARAARCPSPCARPGNDAELALGFLYGEGHAARTARRHRRAALRAHRQRPARHGARGSAARPRSASTRNFYTTSSCGVCGKASIDAVTASAGHAQRAQRPGVRESVLRALPDTLKASQSGSPKPAACTRSGLFTAEGELSPATKTWAGTTPWTSWSAHRCIDGACPGRTHRAAVRPREFRAAAESHDGGRAGGRRDRRAIDARGRAGANRPGITLVAFLRAGGCNVYCHPERVRPERSRVMNS